MFKKKCTACGYTVDKQWNFCPNCAAPLNGQTVSLGNINIDPNKMMQQMMGLLGSVLGGAGFSNPQTQQQKQSNIREKFAKGATNVNEIVEPEDLVSESGDTTVHTINLPGVKNKADVNVTKMENSIEVRAVTGKRLYLKIIPRQKGEGILSEQFAKDNLILVLKKV